MPPLPHITFLKPLLVGVALSFCAILIHLFPVRLTINMLRREKRLGHLGSFWIDMSVIARLLLYASAAHILEVTLWAGLYIRCGEFPDFPTAFYHSAVNYTSLGYGDILMTPAWRLLGPIETANGMLLFGITTAILIAVLQRLLEARFSDLRDS